jgi:type IV pilus assembly protein PilO
MKKPTISLEALEPFFDKIGKLSQVQRILIFCSTLLILIGAFVYFAYLPKFKKVSELQTKYKQVKQQLVLAKQKASQLEKYRKEYAKAKDNFKIVRKSLPEKKEIPDLLASVSRSGQEAGLDFLLFQPQPEVMKEFYSVIPVDIQVEGTYQEFETFFDNVSKLPRIVNIDNIKITPKKDSGLITSCRAVTYRFVEPKGQKQEKKK